MKKMFLFPITLLFISFMKSDSVFWVQKAYYGGGQIQKAASFSVNDIGFVGTGTNQSADNLGGFTRNFYKYDPNSDVWNAIESLPSTAYGRTYATGFSISDRGYVCGGSKYNLFSSINNSLNDLWEYNPETDLWSQRKNFPRGITNGTGFSIGTKGYVGLGITNPWEETNSFYEYNPSSNKWTQLNDFPGSPRQGAIGFSYDGKGYVGLGYDYQSGNGIVYFTDFWAYNPDNDSWNRLSNFPGEGRMSAIGFGVDNCLYIGMGEPNDFYKYDLSTEEWEFLSYLPGSARYAGCSFCLGHTIFYGSGKIPSGSVLSDFWGYEVSKISGMGDVITNEIFQIYPIPTSGILIVKCSEHVVIDEIKIYDTTGKFLKSFINANRSIDISDLETGAYILMVFAQNQKVHQQKILKIY